MATPPRGPAEPPRLSAGDVARRPLPGTAVPGAIAFSPDDRLVTYLHSPEGSLVRQLFCHDVETGEVATMLTAPGLAATEQDLPLSERLRRERRRELGLGVTRYAWAGDADALLVPLPDGVYVQHGRDGELRRVVDAEPAPALDPQLSPDARLVAYVRDGELHVVPADGSRPSRQLTVGGGVDGRTRGLAEFVAQEEMGRASGYWWSRSGGHLAFCEVDESAVPLYRIVHHGSDQVGTAAEEEHRYPFAGGRNARVRLGVVAVGGGDPVWMDLGDDEAYLARVAWLPDGGLSVQVQSRDQSRLDLLRLDPVTGASTVLLTETSEAWVNLHDLFRPLAGGGFLWASERTGFRHLSLHDAEGRLLRTLTEGDWLVDSVAAVDEGEGLVWFTATRDGATERHLYVVPMGGGQLRRLSPEAGVHAVVVDHGHRRFVDTHSSTDQPPVVTLRALHDGSVLRALHGATDTRVRALRPPELVTVTTRDGLSLHAALYRPEGEGPFPTVVDVYGGPGAQRVRNSWEVTVNMRAQALRSLGFLVVTVDNRGSAGRGVAFEAAIRHDLGNLEVRDQVDGVRWLVERGLADPGRVGIYGWSYGGYLAVMALARAPGTFSVAAAGAPVTDWDGYDTHYTERYMGTPASNPDGYHRSSLLHRAGAVSGKLLLVHGLLDENVHFRHTARLVKALIRARVRHDLLLFPDERHLPRDEADRVHMEERIRDFFLRHL